MKRVTRPMLGFKWLAELIRLSQRPNSSAPWQPNHLPSRIFASLLEIYDNPGTLPETCLLRPCKYLNNVLEQDHRFVKRRVNSALGFGVLATAQYTIQGYGAIHLLCKGRIEGMTKGDVLAQTQVINQLFGLTA